MMYQKRPNAKGEQTETYALMVLNARKLKGLMMQAFKSVWIGAQLMKQAVQWHVNSK